MMKKRIVMVLMLFGLAACAKETPAPVVPEKVQKVDVSETPVQSEETHSQPEETPVHPEETQEEPATNPEGSQNDMSRSEYISTTFAENGYAVPAESTWIVKEEGDHKVAVIIKEFVGQGKPLISKLIFLEGNPNTILFLQVENTILIDQ